MTRLSGLKELKLIDLDSWKNTEGMLSSLSACTALQRCILQWNMTLTSVRVLDLACLTALEELDLERCRSLKSIPDLKQVVNLRRLMLGGCRGLEVVKVGEATLTGLEELSLQYPTTQLSTGSCSELVPFSAFSNLRKLWVDGTGFPCSVDVEIISLPPSLEELCLSCFKKAKTMPDLTALVNLKRLEVCGWYSLTSMTGLGSLTKLESLEISGCYNLREVRHVGPSSNLEDVEMMFCEILQEVSIMFGFRRRFKMRYCPMIPEAMFPVEVLNSLLFRRKCSRQCFPLKY